MQSNNLDQLKSGIRFLKPDKKRGLLKLLSSKITEKMLVNIVRKEMGSVFSNIFEENMAALRMIVKKYQIPTTKELDYEVLWSNTYEVYENKDKNEEYNRHVERAFCCTVLITANTVNNNGYYGPLSEMYENVEYYLIQLIESCNYLGKDFLLGTIDLLAWEINEVKLYEGIEWNIPAFLTYSFALIYLLLKTDYPVSETDLKKIVDHLNSVQAGYYYRDWWIFDNVLEENLKWIKLSEELNTLAKKLKDESLKNELQKMLDKIFLYN